MCLMLFHRLFIVLLFTVLFLGDIALDEEDVEIIFGESSSRIVEKMKRWPVSTNPRNQIGEEFSLTQSLFNGSLLPPFLKNL